MEKRMIINMQRMSRGGDKGKKLKEKKKRSVVKIFWSAGKRLNTGINCFKYKGCMNE